MSGMIDTEGAEPLIQHTSALFLISTPLINSHQARLSLVSDQAHPFPVSDQAPSGLPLIKYTLCSHTYFASGQAHLWFAHVPAIKNILCLTSVWEQHYPLDFLVQKYDEASILCSHGSVLI
eukprot:scaffold216655_cov17-Tisochrysis_lutea.AAC.1